MKRFVYICLLAMALLLTGCTMRTEDLYAPPKRSEGYNDVQTAIDQAMGGLTYSAPISGENQQTVQLADLDGDGQEEYLVFAKGTGEKPLKVLIFGQDTQNKAKLLTIIENAGAAFQQVEYIQMDDRPGCEIVLGRQVSDQVQRSVSVYSFHRGMTEQLMSVSYDRMVTCDLDNDGSGELLVIQPGETDGNSAVAVLYSFRGTLLERSMEVELSQRTENIKRITYGFLQDRQRAVYIASSLEESSIVTDVLALRDSRLVNIAMSSDEVQTLRNYYVYGEDVDGDGILELPSLLGMVPLYWNWNSDRQYLIRWYSLDLQGEETDKRYTYHNYLDGWCIQLDSRWASRITVEQVGDVYTFYEWDEQFESVRALFTIYVHSGLWEDGTDSQDRFVLHRTDTQLYTARLEGSADVYGITRETLINSFRLIRGTGDN